MTLLNQQTSDSCWINLQQYKGQQASHLINKNVSFHLVHTLTHHCAISLIHLLICDVTAGEAEHTQPHSPRMTQRNGRMITQLVTVSRTSLPVCSHIPPCMPPAAGYLLSSMLEANGPVNQSSSELINSHPGKDGTHPVYTWPPGEHMNRKWARRTQRTTEHINNKSERQIS